MKKETYYIKYARMILKEQLTKKIETVEMGGVVTFGSLKWLKTFGVILYDEIVFTDDNREWSIKIDFLIYENYRLKYVILVADQTNKVSDDDVLKIKNSFKHYNFKLYQVFAEEIMDFTDSIEDTTFNLLN